MPRVGVRDVAAAARVSIGTVSHYLNAPERVSPEKQARIQEAIDRLGFVRNSAAGQLRNGRSQIIGYVAPEVSTAYFGLIAEGVEKRAVAAGYSVLIASSHGDAQRELDHIAMFEEQRVDGLIVASRYDVEDTLAHVRNRGIPSVLVSRQARTPDQPSVAVDDRAGGLLVGAHLLHTGRRRIAFAGGPFTITQVTDRFTGLQDALANQRALIEVLDCADRSIEAGIRIGGVLAARRPDQRPDAVFAVNDMIAMGIMQALIDGGVRVPEDIAVVGYDDVPVAAASIVPLTSVRATRDTHGEAAFDLLRDAMEAQEPSASSTAAHLVFQPTLNVRRSSAARPETEA